MRALIHERGMNVEGHIMGNAATFMRMREGIMIIKIRGHYYI